MHKALLYVKTIFYMVVSTGLASVLATQEEGPRSWKALESQDLFAPSNNPRSAQARVGVQPVKEESSEERARRMEGIFFKVQHEDSFVAPRSTVLGRRQMIAGLAKELFPSLVTVLLGLWIMKMFLLKSPVKRSRQKVGGSGRVENVDDSLSMDGMVLADQDSKETASNAAQAISKQPARKAVGNNGFEFSHDSSAACWSEQKSETVSSNPCGSKPRRPTFSGSLARHGKWPMASGESSDSLVQPAARHEEPPSPSSPLKPDEVVCLEEAGDWSPRYGRAVTWRRQAEDRQMTSQMCRSEELNPFEEPGIITNQEIAKSLGQISTTLQRMETRKYSLDQWGQSMDAFQSGCVMLNVSILLCYVISGRWQRLFSSCTASIFWWDMRTYGHAAECIVKESACAIFFLGLAFIITRYYISCGIFSRKRPLSTPFLVLAFFSVGCLEEGIVFLAGGRLWTFAFVWTLYSWWSISRAKKVKNVCREYQKSLQVDEGDSGFRDDSASGALLLGVFLPFIMAVSSFCSWEILDYLLPPFTELWGL